MTSATSGAAAPAVPVERMILLMLFGGALCGLVAYLVWLVVRACQRKADRWALKRAAELTQQQQQQHHLQHPKKKKAKALPAQPPSDDDDDSGGGYPYGAVNGAEGDGVVLMED